MKTTLSLLAALLIYGLMSSGHLNAQQGPDLRPFIPHSTKTLNMSIHDLGPDLFELKIRQHLSSDSSFHIANQYLTNFEVDGRASNAWVTFTLPKLHCKFDAKSYAFGCELEPRKLTHPKAGISLSYNSDGTEPFVDLKFNDHIGREDFRFQFLLHSQEKRTIRGLPGQEPFLGVHASVDISLFATLGHKDYSAWLSIPTIGGIQVSKFKDK